MPQTAARLGVVVAALWEMVMVRRRLEMMLMGLAVVAAGLWSIGGQSAAKDAPPGAAPAKSAAAMADPLKGMAQPQYDKDGALLRPEGYERWIFVGTSQGLDYSEEKDDDGPKMFHNVYLQPEAFDYFAKHGKFPEMTVFVMTNNPATKKKGPDLINKRGHFAGPSAGLEVAVKDSSRFDDGWAYFMYKSVSGPRTSAKAFAQKACFDCHAEHGEVDNVFVQFYSVLEGVRPRDKAAKTD